MKTIGIFYATLTKTTVGIVDEIEFFLKKDDFKTFNVKNGVKEIHLHIKLEKLMQLG